MADEDVDLNPIATTTGSRRGRKMPPPVLDLPPADGGMILTVHSIVLKSGRLNSNFTISRHLRDITIPVMIMSPSAGGRSRTGVIFLPPSLPVVGAIGLRSTSSLTEAESGNPQISAGSLHGVIIKFFGATADATIAKILSGDGEVSEHSLIGNSTADYNVSYKLKLAILIFITLNIQSLVTI